MSKRAMAAVYVGTDDMPFIITETPSEAATIIGKAVADGHFFAQLTLGNTSDWNAKPLYVQASSVFAISPPKDMNEDEE